MITTTVRMPQHMAGISTQKTAIRVKRITSTRPKGLRLGLVARVVGLQQHYQMHEQESQDDRLQHNYSRGHEHHISIQTYCLIKSEQCIIKGIRLFLGMETASAVDGGSLKKPLKLLAYH